MDNPVTKLIEALEASELAEKDEFKRKITFNQGCITGCL